MADSSEDTQLDGSHVNRARTVDPSANEDDVQVNHAREHEHEDGDSDNSSGNGILGGHGLPNGNIVYNARDKLGRTTKISLSADRASYRGKTCAHAFEDGEDLKKPGEPHKMCSTCRRKWRIIGSKGRDKKRKAECEAATVPGPPNNKRKAECEAATVPGPPNNKRKAECEAEPLRDKRKAIPRPSLRLSRHPSSTPPYRQRSFPLAVNAAGHPVLGLGGIKAFQEEHEFGRRLSFPYSASPGLNHSSPSRRAAPTAQDLLASERRRFLEDRVRWRSDQHQTLAIFHLEEYTKARKELHKISGAIDPDEE